MKIAENLHAFFWNSMSVNNCNTYLLEGAARVLIDPGHAHLFGHVEGQLSSLGLTPDDIDLVIATHCHPDHVEAVKRFRNSRTLFAVHSEDWMLIKDMIRYLGGSLDLDSFTPAFFLQEGKLVMKDIHLQVIHTPGHSPGSVSIYWPEKKALFSGDVLFKEGLGRTDLPGGNGEKLKESIRRLSALNVERLLPGHGDIVQGTRQVQRNFQRVEQFWFAYI